MMDVAYYICVNNGCEKHRGIFAEGDPQHEGCERDRLYLEGQSRGLPATFWIGLGAAVLALAAVAVTLRLRSQRTGVRGEDDASLLRDETGAWSADYSASDQRREQPVPPPIS